MTNAMRTTLLSMLTAALLASAGCAVEMDLTDDEALTEDELDSEAEALAQCGHFINALITQRGRTTSSLYLRIDSLFVECRAAVVSWRVKRDDTGATIASGPGSSLPANFNVYGLLPGRTHCFTGILTSSTGFGLTEHFCFNTADAPIFTPPGGIGGWH